MISVILYGRNDSYGYNLHKRAAISLNCIAEVLTHPEDEIIFVDCNTPDDLPTFPQAIQDTLTPQAKSLLRILRLPPRIYEKYKKGSPLKALEPLSRNIAIRRSNSLNRWILSTNTDMVLIPRPPEKSLSDVVIDLPDGLYELPRFEVPESLWETLDRNDPKSVIDQFKKWGQKLHLNEVIESQPYIRYDGPGDFQLMPREQIFAIHGFNEEMVLGWHVDSNLCKRLFLLNGKTESLIEQVFAYHCDHTLQYSFVHSEHRTENDLNRFVHSITSPFLTDQAETWGIPEEEIGEILLTKEHCIQFGHTLEDLLPGLSDNMSVDVFLPESFDHGQLYDTYHAFPFLSNHLKNIQPLNNIGYFGGNKKLLQLMNEFLNRSGHRGNIFISSEFIDFFEGDSLPKACIPLDEERIIRQSDLFIFDVGMVQISQFMNEQGISFPISSPKAKEFVKKMRDSFLKCVQQERKRIESHQELPRKFILVGSQHTWFERFSSEFIGTVLSTYGTHVRHGYLKSSLLSDFPQAEYGLKGNALLTGEVQPPSLPDPCWEEVAIFINRYIREDEELVGPKEFASIFKSRTHLYSTTFFDQDIDVPWVIVHKAMLDHINVDFVKRIVKKMKPVFANEVFVIFAHRKEIQVIDLDAPHYIALLDRIDEQYS